MRTGLEDKIKSLFFKLCVRCILDMEEKVSVGRWMHESGGQRGNLS